MESFVKLSFMAYKIYHFKLNIEEKEKLYKIWRLFETLLS